GFSATRQNMDNALNEKKLLRLTGRSISGVPLAGTRHCEWMDSFVGVPLAGTRHCEWILWLQNLLKGGGG
ncbi:MAG: hypothetical protein M0R76_12395, partial [Proteobacteria bacterium]|nr:hypothetical protein [Pseudomonadota bacterium]